MKRDFFLKLDPWGKAAFCAFFIVAGMAIRLWFYNR